MEFNEIISYFLRILDILDKIYHAVVKEGEENAACAGDHDTE